MLMCNKMIILRLMHIQIQAPYFLLLLFLNTLKLYAPLIISFSFVPIYDQLSCFLQTLHMWMLIRLLDETYMVRLNSFHTVVQAVRTAWGCYRAKRQLLYHVKSVQSRVRVGEYSGATAVWSCASEFGETSGYYSSFIKHMPVDTLVRDEL